MEQQRNAEAAYDEVCSQRSEFELRTLYQREIHSIELASLEQFRRFAAAESSRLQAVRAEIERRRLEHTARVAVLKRKIELFDRLKSRQQAAWTADETKELQAAADEAFMGKWMAQRRG